MAKTLDIGQELHSDNTTYRIESVLGQGSFGVTYKVKVFTKIKGKFGEETVELSTPKAVKEFFMKEVNERNASGSLTSMSEGSISYNYAQKFRKEAENLAGMSHPNIVKVIDFISANNTYYYVMDYVEGENLNDYLKHNKISEEEAVRIIKDVAEALQYMHEEKHMLHLDLKPGNVMRRNRDGHIFLIDFGLSKHYSEDGQPETSTSVGLGTPGYSPIEQANSKQSNQFRTTLDIYALGATFYKLLTGQTPPSADELISDDDIIGESLRSHNISENNIAIVKAAMNPNVKKRIQTAKAFLDMFNADKENSEEESVEVLSSAETKPEVEEKHDSSYEDTIIEEHNKYEEKPHNIQNTKQKDTKKTESNSNYTYWAIIGLGLIIMMAFFIAIMSSSTKDKSLDENKMTNKVFSNTSLKFNVKGITFEMKPVEGGTFQMGATTEQGDDYDSYFEKPVHSVTLNDYYICSTEVTQALWKAVMGNNPSHFKGDKLPVEQVKWDDCQTFISKLNQLTSENFRLPTEAEWEYAARGGKKRKGYKYSGSNSLDKVAWYADNSGEKTHEVATKQPNELGLYDMSGNVWEWCQDWYGDYSSSSQTNPTGASTGSNRVLRGGYWGNGARYCRSSYRGYDDPADRGYSLGLRLALTP